VRQSRLAAEALRVSKLTLGDQGALARALDTDVAAASAARTQAETARAPTAQLAGTSLLDLLRVQPSAQAGRASGRQSMGGAMLVLTRKLGEVIRVGDAVTVRVLEVRGNQVRLGVEAPADVRIYREEVYRAIQEESGEERAARPAAAPRLQK